MMVKKSADITLNSELIFNYFNNLVNQFFKVLPMRESEEESLPIYIDSLKTELIGCGGLIPDLEQDSSFLSLLNILQYLGDNPDCSVKKTKREVFKAISICNRLKSKYSEGGAAK